ncbi:MAG: cation transporter [Myxococcota bacterium]|nr:cation transporter [Myxococcota bacterium]
MLIALLASLVAPSHADAVRVRIDGMVCVSCEMKITKALNDLSFVDNIDISASSEMMCADIDGEYVEGEVTKRITDLGYTIKSIERTPECTVEKRKYPVNWVENDGLDVETISRGEEVDLDQHIVAGKFTIFDFGAPWCGPCHVAEKLLKNYLSDHPDVAVRAVVLDSDDAKASFAMPVAHQHLGGAPGLPYFVAVGPNGRTVYRGADVAKLLKKVDAKR